MARAVSYSPMGQRSPVQEAVRVSIHLIEKICVEGITGRRCVKQETVIYFTEKEEELVNLLFDMGIKRNVAKVLVFLAKIPAVTSRVIEKGTGLRQSEVARVMLNLTRVGWIRNQEKRERSKGRPTKIYELAQPFAEILNCIEEGR